MNESVRDERTRRSAARATEPRSLARRSALRDGLPSVKTSVLPDSAGRESAALGGPPARRRSLPGAPEPESAATAIASRRPLRSRTASQRLLTAAASAPAAATAPRCSPLLRS